MRNKRCRLEGAQTLQTQCFAERIDFEQRFAQRVFFPRAARANRVIAFAQCREQVRHRLQWTNTCSRALKTNPKPKPPMSNVSVHCTFEV